MDNVVPLHVWMYRVLFAALVLLVILIHLLPLETTPVRIPAPDVLPCLAFAWVLRRSEYVPIFLIACAFLLTDMFFLRPPGLWAALVVVGAEIVRARGEAFHEMPFSFEWLLVAFVLTGMMVINQIALNLTLADTPSLGLSVIKLIFTIMIYPVVVVISRSVFKVRRLHPGEIDRVGRRI